MLYEDVSNYKRNRKSHSLRNLFIELIVVREVRCKVVRQCLIKGIRLEEILCHDLIMSSVSLIGIYVKRDFISNSLVRVQDAIGFLGFFV